MPQTDYERKLELLEARLTSNGYSNSPIVTTIGFGGPSTSNSASFTELQQATDRHLRKVLENQQSSNHNNNNSNATQVIDNASSKRKQTKPQKRPHPSVTDQSVTVATSPQRKKPKGVQKEPKKEAKKPKAPKSPRKRTNSYTHPLSPVPTTQPLSAVTVSPRKSPRKQTTMLAFAPRETRSQTEHVDWRHRFRQLEQQLATVHASHATQVQSLELTHATESRAYQEALETLVRQAAVTQAAQDRHDLNSKALRLGQFSTQRVGMRYQEVWSDGSERIALVEERNRLQTELQRLEQESPTTPVDRARRSFCLETAQTQLQQVQQQLDQLKTRQVAHIRHARRVAAEDASRFQDRPKVGNAENKC